MRTSTDELSRLVIGSAIEVHRQLGPGLLESTYEQALAYELSANELTFQRQLAIPVNYKGVHLDCGYRLDFLVENSLVLELKAVDKLNQLHSAQILTYMKLAAIDTGLILNFNACSLVRGIKRFKL